MADFTKPQTIVDTPGAQTGKEAVLKNSANIDALISDYNLKMSRGAASGLNTGLNAVEAEITAARGGFASLLLKETDQDGIITAASGRVSELNVLVAAKAPLNHTHTNDGSTFTTTPVFEAVKTSNFTAAVGKAYLIDTSAGSVEMTMPPLPGENDTVIYRDHANTFSTNPLILRRNASGEKIFNVADDFTDRTKGVTRMFAKIGTRGWR